MRNSLQLLVLSVLAGVMLSGCGGGGSTPPGGNGNGNPLPNVTSLSPADATVGEASFTLTVTGSNFVPGSAVNWTGTALTTTFVSSTSLTASVPASNLSNAGTAQVTVTNPSPGGGISSAKTFNINNPAPVVTSLSQASADVGTSDLNLTITGSGFVSTSVVRWNGSSRTTSFGGGTQLTTTIAASDLAIAGSAQVSVANPTPGGGNSSGIPFAITPHIAHGIGLPGGPGSLAINATSDLSESDVNSTVIEGNLVMNRLDVRFARDATADQVNAALASIGGGIVHMSQGFTSVTIAVPPQSSLGNLQALVSHLESFPGVRIAKIARLEQPDAIFPSGSFGFSDMAERIRHLLPSRFPAAWNAAPADVFGDPSNPAVGQCPVSRTQVLVNDVFFTPPVSDFTDFFAPFTGPAELPSGYPQNFPIGHGYFVTEVLGANGFGADPFPATSSCALFNLVQTHEGGFTPNEVTDNLIAHMPTDRFVVNFSMSWGNECGTLSPCLPPQDTLRNLRDRADDALYWKEKTRHLWDTFLIVASAGNARDKESTAIYPGMGDSRFNSWVTVAQLPDNLFQFVSDDSLWTPSPTFAAQGFTSLKPTADEQAQLTQDITDAGMAGPDATAGNVISVGSVSNQPASTTLTAHVTPDQLAESTFSNSGADVLAVGEHLLTPVDLDGTSFSAPQVAGLISYLWMISPDLRDVQPVSVTKQSILANTRNKVIDAYATVLSLDAAALPNGQNMPIRQTLLDVNRNVRFDEGDIDQFLRHLFLVDSQGNITRQVPANPNADFSRFDLNGDGFTTSGSRRERFDLDRVGSTQYGDTKYNTPLGNISQTIEGQEIRFDETDLTDLEILCYYAYSPMYAGDSDQRRDLLAGRCGLAVQPATATLSPGQTQQFTANTPANDPATWTATCGTIDANGLYTAGNDAGPCTVRATDVNNSSLSGTATVSISGTFIAEEEYSVTIGGTDFFTRLPVFPAAAKAAGNTRQPIALGPIDLGVADIYQRDAQSSPTNYSISGHGDGPIENPVSGSGTFTGNVSCSASGSQGNGGLAPFMPQLQVSYSGALNVTVPDGGLSFSLNGTLLRGETVATSFNTTLGAEVSVVFQDAGGEAQHVQFVMNDGMHAAPTAAEVPVNWSVRLSPPGFVDVHWGVTAACYQDPDGDGAINVARNGSATLTYGLGH